MSMLATMSPVEVLEERLTRGAELLFDLEQRGDLGMQYMQWLRHWEALLVEYEKACAA